MRWRRFHAEWIPAMEAGFQLFHTCGFARPSNLESTRCLVDIRRDGAWLDGGCSGWTCDTAPSIIGKKLQ